MTLLSAAVVLLVAGCHAQLGPLVVPYYQPLVQPYYYHIAPNVLRSVLETKSDPVETPLRESVEAQPSELVKHQTRIADLLRKAAPFQQVVPYDGCGEGSYKPHAECTQYFFCVHGKWTPNTCPNGLHWDNSNSVCNFPDQAGCTAGGDGGDDNAVDSVPDAPETAPVVAEFEEWENPPTPSTTPQTTPSTTTQDWNKPWQPPTPPPRPDYDGKPLNNGLSGDFKIVCYFTNWATYRQTGGGKFDPEDIDYRVCTHIIYGFAVLDSNTLLVKSHDPYADMSDGYSGKDMYRKVTEFKKHGIKVTLALGGWNDSKGDKYSRLVNNPSARSKFIDHVIKFIEKHDFDGLDLDWEYPSCWQVKLELQRFLLKLNVYFSKG